MQATVVDYFEFSQLRLLSLEAPGYAVPEGFFVPRTLA